MIYLDESGDLGFGPRASKHFILAAVIARNPSEVGRCIKRVREQRLPKKYKQIPELKFHNSSQSIRERVLKCFSKTDNDIAYVILRKEQVYPSLREERTILYNYMSGMLLSKIIKAYNWEGSLDLIIDKSLYNSQRDNFDNYLTRKASALNVTLNPSHPDSQRERGVQAADYVAGAINQMYCGYSDCYYKLIEQKISILIDLFDGKGKDCVVNPSLLRPIRLRAASSFSGRTYNTTYTNTYND